MLKQALLIICILSVSLLNSQTCYQEPVFCQPCTPTGFRCDGSIIGTIVLGAGAGALAGWAASSNNHTRTRERCFHTDEKGTLSLDLTLEIKPKDVEPYTIRPFITTPNGKVIQGPVVEGEGENTISFQPLEKVVIGQYQFGVWLEFPEGTKISKVVDSAFLTAKVETPSGISYAYNNITDIHSVGSNLQLIVNYTYQ